MFYRLVAFINTREKVPIDKLKEQVQKVQRIAETINAGEDNKEPSLLIIHKCYHDEYPGTPCDTLYEWSSEDQPT